ncbi:Do family serine endopeptidase [Rhodohalobacter sulfatireducens]|uniref:Do family serine endopeptidase n=1 Tax=Rhodohalobacter sulfatireducens TaxID=2911366 RepID=A0ABS9KES2_9BACT|nr:Do family serine endopeptidase [Rhodohalobacter sulfatireducens]MCG2589320.1 Do family serine endopeptidase [Rhodohalobacter sulfatireducens]
MDRLKISIAAMFAVVSLFIGVHYATDNGSNSASVFNLPTFNQTETTADQTPITTLKDFNDAIVNIADRTNKTVVTITTTQTITRRQQSPFSFFFDDPRFDQEREYQRQGLGSGVIVSDDGYIITNNHVIENADEINVRFFDGDEVDAEIVGTDPASDIAVLKVESEEDLSAIAMGDSESIRVGEMVLAIGSPLNPNLAHSVSMGIVSASGRSSVGLNVYENYIQTDAAINPGNSGGALINLDGELVGINTAIASRSGGNQGVGFAIPVNMARDVMESLITEGRVARGYLGIGGSTVDRTMASALGLESARGVIIGEVLPDTPAANAGLREGDVIVSLDGEQVSAYRDFQVAIGSKKPGDEIALEIIRDGEEMEFEVELTERPDQLASTNDMNDEQRNDLRETLGFSVDGLNDNIRNQLDLSENVQGVVVTNISQGSQSYRQGLRRGDVITRVGENEVNNPNEFYSAIQSYIDDETEAVLLRVNRQGRNVFIAIELM